MFEHFLQKLFWNLINKTAIFKNQNGKTAVLAILLWEKFLQEVFKHNQKFLYHWIVKILCDICMTPFQPKLHVSGSVDPKSGFGSVLLPVCIRKAQTFSISPENNETRPKLFLALTNCIFFLF